MEEFQQPHIHMKDPDKVNQVLKNIIADGPHKLQVVADFDRTLTKYKHNGQICATCHNVLEESHVLPDLYKQKAKEFRDYYFPLEMNPKLSVEEKIPVMIEWWTKAHDLLAGCEMTKDSIKSMVENSSAMLRDGCNWLFDELSSHNIPLLIFSAGLGDILEEIIKCKATFHNNMKVVSNYMDFDGNGKMCGFKGDLIHTYNKNESSVHDSDYFKDLQHRSNIILMGDSIGDLHMADGAEEVQNKLTIGFLNVQVEESLELYKRKYDVVIVQDETLDIVNSLVRNLVKNK